MLISSWLSSIQAQIAQSSSLVNGKKKRKSAGRKQRETLASESALLEERILLSHVLGMAQQPETLAPHED